MPGCIVSATTANFSSVEKRRLRATPVITSTFENVSDIGTCLGLFLGPLGYRPCPVKTGCTPKNQFPADMFSEAVPVQAYIKYMIAEHVTGLTPKDLSGVRE